MQAQKITIGQLLQNDVIQKSVVESSTSIADIDVLGGRHQLHHMRAKALE
jgi:hypothetical protein